MVHYTGYREKNTSLPQPHEATSGTKRKLVGEVHPVPHNFNEGKFQDVGKIPYEGEAGDAKNIPINRVTISAAVDEDSNAWMAAHARSQIAGADPPGS